MIAIMISMRETNKQIMSTSFFDRTGEYMDAVDYLHKVLKLVILEPVNKWFGGSLDTMDLQKVMVQIESMNADGLLQIEFYEPKSGETARSLLAIIDGTIKAAVLRITSCGNDLTGLSAIQKVVEFTSRDKTIVGSFFFQARDTMPMLDQIAINNLNIRSDDLMSITEAVPEFKGETLIGVSHG